MAMSLTFSCEFAIWVDATELHYWGVNVGSGIGLALSGKKPLSESYWPRSVSPYGINSLHSIMMAKTSLKIKSQILSISTCLGFCWVIILQLCLSYSIQALLRDVSILCLSHSCLRNLAEISLPLMIIYDNHISLKFDGCSCSSAAGAPIKLQGDLWNNKMMMLTMKYQVLWIFCG